MLTTDVINRTAQAFGVQRSDILGTRKSRHIAWARQAAAWALRQEFSYLSCIEIGRLLNRDHTTVLYAFDAVEKRRRINPDFRRRLYQIAMPANVSSSTLSDELERRDPAVREFLEECEV